MRKGLRHNDIKEQNILFRKFDKEMEINYKIEDKYFTIKIYYLLFLILGKFESIRNLMENLKRFLV